MPLMPVNHFENLSGEATIHLQKFMTPEAIRSYRDKKSSMFVYNTNLLPIDYYLSLNRTKECPKMVRLSLFQEQ